MKGKFLRIAAVLLIGLALVWPVPQSVWTRLTLALSDFLHFPLAMLLFWLVSGLVPSRRFAVVFVLAAAAVMECVQPFLGRSASVIDFIYAALGVLGAVIASSRWRGELCEPVLIRRRGLSRRSLLAKAEAPPSNYDAKMRVAFVLLCLLALVPVGAVMWDQYSARRDFPLLAGFESPLERGRWTLNGVSMKRARSHSTQGRFAAEVSVSESGFEYPGFFLEDMPRDWREAEALQFDIFWPGEAPRELCVRMDDRKYNPAYQNRFQKSFVLNPGMNRIRLERNEFGVTSGGTPLDLSHVMRMGLFYFAAEKGEVLFLDEVRLLKGGQ